MLFGPPGLTARTKKNNEERIFRGADPETVVLIKTWFLSSCLALDHSWLFLFSSRASKGKHFGPGFTFSLSLTRQTRAGLHQLLPPSSQRSISLNWRVLRTDSSSVMKTLTYVFLDTEVPPKVPEKKKKDNLACLATYLIAKGHQLCLSFPLLVFWALTWLISCLALIRGRISEHSWVSQTTRWESWSAINQSDFPFIVVKSGKEPNADRVGHAESELLGCAGGA